MTLIYLSSENPRWIPKTEADLKAAIDGGVLDESHYLDLKEAPNNKTDNKELARDLASFAVDGGTLIIGVKEHKESRHLRALTPAPERAAREGRAGGAFRIGPAAERHHRGHRDHSRNRVPLPLSS
ncbi:AlbA family DNA-binding domain-containing protein [Streptomyces atratus]|uniref:AlbA family DNA-binding domain-containing protein n=1 Tax=Streptomyces atratus TaxID=1893 RepID=UPI003F69F93F